MSCPPLRLHSTRPIWRARGALPWAVLAWTLLLASLAPALARAQVQVVRPWVPPGLDSLLTWSADARADFKANRGDSVGGDNYRAYDRVGTMGRRLLRSLGPERFSQARLIEGPLDSLGMEVSVAQDPSQPGFVVLMVRNPYRWTAHAVGFLYWYHGDDLRMQGAEFRGGLHPSMRVWWNADRRAPYEWGVIEQSGDPPVLRFTLFHIDPSGEVWNLAQDEDTSPVLGGSGEAAWADINGDGRPEIVSWLRADTDSLFLECTSCPHLVTERTYVEDRDGFEFLDQRLMPSPYTTFVAFARLLHDKNLTAARRLVEDPALVDRAVALGFGEQRGRGTWTLEYGEPGEAWPRWLELRFASPHGPKRYVVHFAMHEGHWLMRDVIEPRVRGETPAQTLPPAARPPVRRPGGTARRLH